MLRLEPMFFGLFKTKLKATGCAAGIHQWRSIRRTHYNSWSGKICELCGQSQSTIERIAGAMGGKMDVNDFVRVAGGNKPMDYDK